jgi:hypothetical protein
MGFFDVFTRAVSQSRRGPSPEQGRLAALWGVYETPAPDPESDGNAANAGADPDREFDRVQWRKKLKRILERLPATQAEWQPMLTEARALSFDDEWVTRVQIDEFGLLMRRAVADCHFTEAEHDKIELARTLIGIPEAEAEAMLQVIIKEAETFFGHRVEGA